MRGVGRLLWVGAAVCSALIGPTASAQESRPRFYFAPVSAVVGTPSAAGIQASIASSGMINSRAMSQFFDDSIADFLGQQFTSALRGEYGNAAVSLNQVDHSDSGTAPEFDTTNACPARFRVDFRKSFAAVLGVSRFSFYANRFSLPGGASNAQILIPVTYTIRFIEFSSATPAYSKSVTIYTRFEGDTRETFEGNTQNLTPGVRATLRKAISDDALRAISLLIAESRKEFTPGRQTATVLGSDRGYFFLDRGSDAGLTAGKTTFATAGPAEVTLAVQYATTGLAVVSIPKQEATLVREGVSLELSVSGRGVDSAKPTVMAVPYRGQSLSSDQVRDNALMGVLAADLGKGAPFNVLVNDDEIKNIKDHLRAKFCDKAVVEKMPGFTSTSLNKQKAPDFYLKVDSAMSPVFAATGVGGVTSNQIFLTTVGLSLIDNQALIRQATIGSSPYELKVTAGKGLSLNEASEINLKNAGVKAVEALTRQFRFDTRTVRVTGVTPDPGGALRVARLAEGLSPSEKKAVRFVRPLTVPKTRRVVNLPLDVEVARSDADPATVTVFGEVRDGDVALVEAGSAQVKVMALCDGAPQRRFQMAQLSSASNAEVLMGRAVSASLKGYRLAETDSRFVGSVKDALKDNFFEDRLAPFERGDFCLLPMEVQAGPGLQCGPVVCTGNGVVGSGIRLFDKGNKIAESLISGQVQLNDIPAGMLSPFLGLKAHEFQARSASEHVTQLSKQ